MKIKTIIHGDPDSFDGQVNRALDEGYLLERRGPEPTMNGFALYAQLVLPDPPAEPEAPDPIEALHAIKAACLAQPRCDICPMTDWCGQLTLGGDPTDWDLPEVDA